MLTNRLFHKRRTVLFAVVLFLSCFPAAAFVVMKGKQFALLPIFIAMVILLSFLSTVTKKEVAFFKVIDFVPLFAITNTIWALRLVLAAFVFLMFYEWEIHWLLTIGGVLCFLILLDKMRVLKEVRLVMFEGESYTLKETITMSLGGSKKP